MSAPPRRACDTHYLATYALRLAVCVALLEACLHYAHPFAVGASGAYARLAPAHVGLLAYVVVASFLSLPRRLIDP